jgi:hypothetical protein
MVGDRHPLPLATPTEQQELVEVMKGHPAWEQARNYTDAYLHTVPRLQPRLARSLTEYGNIVARTRGCQEAAA